MNFLLFTRTRHLKTCQYFYLQQKQSLHLDSDVLDDKQTLLKNTANSLYKVGYLRLASDKTSENVYQHFAEPTNTLNLNIDNYKESLKDFLEIHDVTLNFGSPETADQMSGAIYLHASISEDKCSQCLRLASEVVPGLSINELLLCLSSVNWWSSQTGHSLALKELITALDNICIDRLKSSHFLLKDQLRLAYQWQSVMFSPSYKSRFTSIMLKSFPTSTILQSSLPLLVSWLLLLSSTERFSTIGNSSDLARQISNILNSGITLKMLSEPELVSCYLGLRSLTSDPEVCNSVVSVLQSQFGYRI